MKNNSSPCFDAIVKKADTIEFWDFKTARPDYGSRIRELILSDHQAEAMKMYDLMQEVASVVIPTMDAPLAQSWKTYHWDGPSALMTPVPEPALKQLAHEILGYEIKPVFFCNCPIRELMDQGCHCGGA